ncbi:hypothetical protein PG999_003827 [Apiospora kogelbergensis]|uniref:FAD/NAD(P)-binding domain-containing protein n=1 Tax=Apiospora kogelbergensis TaxID=1337665 RepID=A0AAW0R4W7_9PEZI
MMDSHNQGVRSTANPFKVLIAGGCYSGLAAAINLLDKCDSALDSRIPVSITIVDERSGFFHVIGSPLALSSKEYADKCWVDFADVKILQRPDVRFVHGRVQKVDPASRTATILDSASQTEQSETYDYFIAATGLRRVWPVVPQSLTRKTYLLEAGQHIDAVRSSAHPVLVVGGGAVGIEMAAELKMVQPNVQVTLAHSRDKLLSAEPLPDDVKDRALELVREAGVDTLMGHRLQSSRPLESGEGYDVEFTNGHKMVASVVIEAISRSVPATDYLPRAALTDEHLVRIRPTMQLAPAEGLPEAEADRHFAVGDLIAWSGIKRCGAAMHEGRFAGLNIHQLMLQELSAFSSSGSEEKHKPEFQELQEIPPMIGLAVGKKGLSYGPDVGMDSGEEVLKLFFGDDLGFKIVWDYLRLGQDPVKV